MDIKILSVFKVIIVLIVERTTFLNHISQKSCSFNSNYLSVHKIYTVFDFNLSNLIFATVT